MNEATEQVSDGDTVRLYGYLVTFGLPDSRLSISSEHDISDDGKFDELSDDAECRTEYYHHAREDEE